MKPNMDLDVLWPRLISIADEVAVTLVRTAFSIDIKENFDLATAIFDDRGMMIAQGNLSTPGHVGSMPNLMKTVGSYFERDGIQEGDVLITNDPWIGCGQTSDVFVITPVFMTGRLIGYVVNSAHQMDIGGRQASTESRDVYEEGIQIPPLKLLKQGQPNEDIWRIIQTNVRFSEKVLGDIRAQIAANWVGCRRLIALLKESGLPDLQTVADEVIARTEQSMRREIAALPDGAYQQIMMVEADDAGGQPLKVVLTVTINGDHITLDFTGTSLQVDRPVNIPLNYTTSYAILGIKLACDPYLPNNEGPYRCVTITAPLGTLVNASYPAPVYWRSGIGMCICDVVMAALSPVCKGRVPAETGALPVWMFSIAGTRSTGETFVIHSHSFGGTGARPGKDGLSATGFPYNVRDVPTEILENETPFMCVKREYLPDSGGEGQFRGGLGETMVLRAAPGGVHPTKPIKISISAGKLHYPAAGLDGGLPGRCGEILVNDRPGGRTAWQDLLIQPADVVTLRSPGGGGYGLVGDRASASLAEDRKQGYVT